MLCVDAAEPGAAHMSRKRSVVWGFFKAVDSLSVRCVLCSDYQSKQVRGSTTNMLRHLRVKHPEDFAKTFRGRASKSSRRKDRRAGDPEHSERSYYSVDVVLENEDSDDSVPLNESDINAAISEILEAAQGDAAEEDTTHAEASDDPPVRDKRPRRSLVWRHFKRLDGLDAAQCRICMKKLQCFEGTSNLRRHLSAKHPEMFARLVASGMKPPPSNSDTVSIIAVKTEPKHSSVDVVLENEDPDDSVPLDESDNNAAISDILEAAQGDAAEEEDTTHAEPSDDPPVRDIRPRRSLIWRHFERLDGLNAAQCRICMKKLQFFESTGNLRRHLSAKHPERFARLVASGLKPPPSNSDTVSTAAVKTEPKHSSVDVVLENEDPDDSVPLDESDINADISDILEAAQGDAAEEEDTTHAEASDDPPVRDIRPRRSLIWRHFKRLDDLNAAQCRICMKKLQCFEGTSNLRRHLSTRHPEMFARLVASGLKPPPSNSDTVSTAAGKTELKHSSGSSEGVKRVWRREQELIEALRRTQKEEARALEIQRDLLEKMRAADAREATAEREKIQTLRKEQQEEAKQLTVQREELQKEKAELQKNQEQLQQQRQQLLLLSRGQECSTITSPL